EEVGAELRTTRSGICGRNRSSPRLTSDRRNDFHASNGCNEDGMTRRRSKETPDPDGAWLADVALDQGAAIQIQRRQLTALLDNGLGNEFALHLDQTTITQRRGARRLDLFH